jgi:hypothetical protein
VKTVKWTLIKTTFRTYTQGPWDEASLPKGRLNEALDRALA